MTMETMTVDAVPPDNLSGNLPTIYTGCENYRLTHNLSADPRLVGNTALWVSMVNKISSQRLNMVSSHLGQIVLVYGREQAQISTGFERLYQDHTFETLRQPDPLQVLAVIPKYIRGDNPLTIQENYNWTVIYYNHRTEEVGYQDISVYTKGADGFGYKNIISGADWLTPGLVIPEGEIISHSPAVHKNEYKLGVNANVIYMSIPEVAEDAFVISRRLADKLTSLAIKTASFNIKSNQIPLNLYGNENLYKPFPNIGETVNPETGIFVGIKTVSSNSLISDIRPTALGTRQVQDAIIYMKPGAKIIDIEVYSNDKKNTAPDLYFAQIKEYHLNRLHYYRAMYNEYLKAKAVYRISSLFNVKMEEVIRMLVGYGDKIQGVTRTTKVPAFSIKRDEIEYMSVNVTYAYNLPVTPGFKITGQDGAKGTIHAIWPTEDMPVDKYGNIADLIAAPESVSDRMNIGQNWVQGINYISEKIKRDTIEIRTTKDDNQAYSYVQEYINYINPEYSKIQDRVVFGKKNGVKKYLDRMEKSGILLVCPPFLKTLNVDLINFLVNRYGIRPTPISYNLRDKEGNLIRKVQTRTSFVIGAKYLWLLCKVPYTKAVAAANINHLRLPVRSASFTKVSSPVGEGIVRFGEDEIRVMIGVLGAPLAYRLISLYANSSIGIEVISEVIFTNKNPSAIGMFNISDEAMLAANKAIGVFKHMCATLGIEFIDISKMVPEDIARIRAHADEVLPYGENIPIEFKDYIRVPEVRRGIGRRKLPVVHNSGAN